MRGKLFFSGFVLVICMMLTSCVQQIVCPADELRMYRWEGTAENGTVSTLSFDEDKARFYIENKDYTLDLNGFCIMTDDRMVLCDEESGRNHIFSYHLYGDRVELGYHNNMIVLIKSE